jgi:AcrR family transcriptional regulator
MVQARHDRLPSGRHHLTREAVQASQRGRLLVAMAETVAAKGYVASTVADVVERAGVSRRTFYEQFPDKEACFLAAYDTGVDVMLSRIRDAVEPLAPADWRARTRTGLQTYLEVLAAEPAFAWCFHIEVLSAGPAALARRSAVHVLFSGLWRDVHQRARAEKPDLVAWPDEGHHMLSAGLEELVRERLRSHGAGSLPAYGETMVGIVFRAFGVGDA